MRKLKSKVEIFSCWTPRGLFWKSYLFWLSSPRYFFFYFFSHQDSRDSFHIGHALKILKEIFRHDPLGGYARRNVYWTARQLADLIAACDEKTRWGFDAHVRTLEKIYEGLSDVYQKGKSNNDIPFK